MSRVESNLRALRRSIGVGVLVVVGIARPSFGEDRGAGARDPRAQRIGNSPVLCAVLGLPRAGGADRLVQFASRDGNTVYFQSPDAEELARVLKAAETAGVLGKSLFVSRGEWRSVHLATNLADVAIVGDAARTEVQKSELLRVLRPGGKAISGEEEIIKPAPEGTDSWSHPYHGPDNNPQSTDRLALAPYLTQFIAEPKFCPMPEVSVAAGGKVYRAFGHIAHKANQNPMLNTLICANAYNGKILWKRKLPEGFMIHRNTMVATPDTLYLADHESCKLIDAETGHTRDEIVIEKGVADGPVWKWMALQDGVLYALMGGAEVEIATQPSNVQGMGHWPWGMWAGHDYRDPETSFGFGRTFVAIDPSTKKVLWTHKEEEHLDSRGICMKNGRIYFYCPEKFLACLDAKTREVLWRNRDNDLLRAIGPNGRAQHYVTGYATTTYIKCNDDYVFFAGPQRSRLVVASAKDGKLVWHKEHGNLQLVLREDGFYAAGPQATGVKFDYATGKELARLPNRRACTRATGSIDSIFYRTPGGTVRIDTATNSARHIAPMRPPCQDGVIISDGHLYWGPWMCGCQLSLYGHICLGPASGYHSTATSTEERLESYAKTHVVADFDVRDGDWPAYLGDSHRSQLTEVTVPREIKQRWSFSPPSDSMPTAPVMAGRLTFVGDRSGALRALDADGKEAWKAYTDGPIYFAPTIAEGRAYVGSADGWVYAFEAATGRLLWRYRVAPAERRIPVYDVLISTWPVAGGAVVQDGVVYAAAGIAHYDGTQVVALDAASGKVKWTNDSSGTLSKNVQSGVSLQGDLRIQGNELQFLGGGVYHTARYDLATGRCINEAHDAVNSRFATAFYPYYPRYAEFLSFHHNFADGKTIRYTASYEGSQHSSLALLGPPKPGAGAGNVETDRPRDARRQAPQREVVWEIPGRRYNSLILAPNAIVGAGQMGEARRRSAFLAAADWKTGNMIWRNSLPGPAVKGGIAIDHDGRIAVALQNGQVICYEPES